MARCVGTVLKAVSAALAEEQVQHLALPFVWQAGFPASVM
ncbi:hypothetical protein T261_8386 [Streptomyces lydicus]|nr:hypothetical protein T261_8386 [Streptomyces lydicus]